MASEERRRYRVNEFDDPRVVHCAQEVLEKWILAVREEVFGQKEGEGQAENGR